jgi:hypothetical protein
VHHPLWDYDIPTAPILVDTVKDGKNLSFSISPFPTHFHHNYHPLSYFYSLIFLNHLILTLTSIILSILILPLILISHLNFHHFYSHYYHN